MKDSNCIFCKITSGEIPSHTIYEDESFKVIFDISPATKGHAIIIPKNHAKDIFELSEEDASKIFVVAKKVASALNEVLQCDGFNILQNNGKIAGQTVFHLHVHLIPRYKDDNLVLSWKQGDPAKELDEIAEKVKAIL